MPGAIDPTTAQYVFGERNALAKGIAAQAIEVGSQQLNDTIDKIVDQVLEKISKMNGVGVDVFTKAAFSLMDKATDCCSRYLANAFAEISKMR